MKLISEPLSGVFVIEPKVFSDHRGSFVKTFHAGIFSDLGMSFTPVEEFFSISHKNVVRGMHFQLPPHDHAKLMYCIQGAVLDVILDLRKESPTYGRAISTVLSGENRHQIFVPRGLAHGFLSLVDHSVMIYKTSTVYAPAHDSGIRWDSFDFDWKLTGSPVLSTRDLEFISFDQFISPFK